MGPTPEEYGFTPEECCEIKASTPKNSIFFYSTPKEILNFYNLPLDNSMVSQPGEGGGGADIKCNSPMKFLSLRRRRLLCETFLAARNEDRRLRSQATNIKGLNEYFLLIRVTFFEGRGREGGGEGAHLLFLF